MSLTTILVKDDSNPLVELTFYPVANKTGLPTWRTQVSGVPTDGQSVFEILDDVRLPDGNYRRVVKLTVPEMEIPGTAGTSAGYEAAPKVAFKTVHTLTTVANQRGTELSNANSLKLLLGFLQGASSTTATGTIDQGSAADALKSKDAPITQFFVWGKIPT
jgi:hypothetical protein